MSDVGEFIDTALRNESSWERASEAREQVGSGIDVYGASVGAVRGTIRDAARKFPGQTHDDVTALATELWNVAVFERRLAAVVLLQTNLHLLIATDLTRIEGFLRTAGTERLVLPLIDDVVVPLFERLDGVQRSRAESVARRWADTEHPALRRGARAVLV